MFKTMHIVVSIMKYLGTYMYVSIGIVGGKAGESSQLKEKKNL